MWGGGEIFLYIFQFIRHIFYKFNKSCLILAFSVVFHMSFWYVHLMMSNLNWVVTSLSYIICSAFHLIIYLMTPDSDPTSDKTSFMFIIVLSHLIYIFLSYTTNKWFKESFYHKLILEEVSLLL